MKIPIFVRGTKENIDIAIERGEIKYPAYIWEKRSGEWWFLNENNVIEKSASHKPVTALVGTLENPIIVSGIEEDGIYAVKGIYRIAPFESATMYSTNSFVLFMVKTVESNRKIKRIAEDGIQDFVVTEEDFTVDRYVTEQYLDSKGYVSQETMDEKLAEIEEELKVYVDEQIGDQVGDIVEEVLEKEVTVATSEQIRELFDDDDNGGN